MFAEKALCKALKERWKSSGYEIAIFSIHGGKSTAFIDGKSWGVIAPLRKLPRALLGMIVEHIGYIPQNEAMRLQKALDSQKMMLDVMLASADGICEMERICDAAPYTRTRLSWDGLELWQGQRGEIAALDPLLTEVASPLHQAARKLDEKTLIWRDEDCLYFVRQKELGNAAELVARLEAIPWAS